MQENDIEKAINALQKGEIIVYPTDTLYGLGADIYNVEAIKRVFKIKKRFYNNPLPVAVSNYDEINKIANTNKLSDVLAEKFLPGPLSIILYKKDLVFDVVTSGLKKIAIRIPNNSIALDLLDNFGPLTATSANIHHKKTPCIISKINMQFKDNVRIYLDDGKLAGLPSTIVDLTSKTLKIIREGAIKQKDILDAIGYG